MNEVDSGAKQRGGKILAYPSACDFRVEGIRSDPANSNEREEQGFTLAPQSRGEYARNVEKVSGSPSLFLSRVWPYT